MFMINTKLFSNYSQQALDQLRHLLLRPQPGTGPGALGAARRRPAVYVGRVTGRRRFAYDLFSFMTFSRLRFWKSRVSKTIS